MALAQHKYSVGESVRFAPDRDIDANARGAYTIVKTLPRSWGASSNTGSRPRSAARSGSFAKTNSIG